MIKNKIAKKIMEVYLIAFEIFSILVLIISTSMILSYLGIKSNLIHYLIGIVIFCSYFAVLFKDYILENEKESK